MPGEPVGVAAYRGERPRPGTHFVVDEQVAVDAGLIAGYLDGNIGDNMAALQLGPGAESLAVHELQDGGAPRWPAIEPSSVKVLLQSS